MSKLYFEYLIVIFHPIESTLTDKFDSYTSLIFF